MFVDAARRLDLAKIRALAAAAAGIRADRGDAVSVEAVAFGDGTPRVVRAARAPGWVLALAEHAAAGAHGRRGGARASRSARSRWPSAAARAVESASARSAAREVATIPPARVRGALEGEPPHVAAAVIAALPAATAAAVLELYPPDERAAIVRRSRARTLRSSRAPEDFIRGR